jgi:DNA gyrase/topoisomerase IV subunit A
MKQIECLKGLPKVIDNIDEVCKIIRKARDARDATEKLKEVFGLTKDQAAYAVGFQLTKLAGISKDNVQENIEHYEKILALLKRLDK